MKPRKGKDQTKPVKGHAKADSLGRNLRSDESLRNPSPSRHVWKPKSSQRGSLLACWILDAVDPTAQPKPCPVCGV